MLATSRIPLATAGGLEYAVDPLPVPPESATAGELEGSPSVQLFLARGRAVRHDLASTPESLTTVGRICRDLDGLPLAIELAAARAKALSLEEVETRLGDRFRFLRTPRRIADPRHRTLQATMDWSYELLPVEMRALLDEMSVFAGGATLEAVAGVSCSGDQERALELVSGLVDASLVARDERSAVTRYRLLETVRQYAAARLDENGGGDDVRRRHAAFFARLAEEAALRSEQAEVLVALAADEGNFRSALLFSSGGREPELMLRLAGALSAYWLVRGQHEEARGWLEQALEHAARCAPHLRALALRRLGGSVNYLGGHVEARALFREALVLHKKLGDDDGVARCLNNLGCVALDEGDLDEATGLFEEALALHRLVDERASLVPLRNLLGVARRRGDVAERQRLCEEVLTAARAWHDELSVADVLLDLALVAAVEGRYDDVGPPAGDALSFFGRVGATEPVTVCVLLAALVLASRGRRVDAAQLVGAATAQRAQRGWPALPEATYGDLWQTVGPRPFAALERELDDERYAAARAAGAGLPFEDVVELAAQALGRPLRTLQPA
jgi:non-specific serine/threonine protein kinase